MCMEKKRKKKKKGRKKNFKFSDKSKALEKLRNQKKGIPVN